MHVLAVGSQEPVDECALKRIDGCLANPNTGSSGAPVTNWRMAPNVTPVRRPAVKQKQRRTFRIISSILWMYNFPP